MEVIQEATPFKMALFRFGRYTDSARIHLICTILIDISVRADNNLFQPTVLFISIYAYK